MDPSMAFFRRAAAFFTCWKRSSVTLRSGNSSSRCVRSIPQRIGRSSRGKHSTNNARPLRPRLNASRSNPPIPGPSRGKHSANKAHPLRPRLSAARSNPPIPGPASLPARPGAAPRPSPEGRPQRGRRGAGMERAEAYGFSGAISGAFLLSCLLFAAVSRRQRGPYMDEVFHVPQAQAYCHGRFLQVGEQSQQASSRSGSGVAERGFGSGWGSSRAGQSADPSGQEPSEPAGRAVLPCVAVAP